ncbi:hypothetical protein H0H87_009924, partial [Tephrocybe sp. NHM501043]
MSDESTAAMQIAAMVNVIAQKRTVTYSNAAAFTIATYDVLLEFPREVNSLSYIIMEPPYVIYPGMLAVQAHLE